MTANVVRVNSNYKIQSLGGGQIILDTGYNPTGEYGKVTVLGDLDVKGAATVIKSNVVSIQDTIITLNVGEIGNGVTGSVQDPQRSGFAVDRGTASDGNARWMWDETRAWLNPHTGTTKYGAWVSRTVVGGLAGIQTNSITTGTTGDNLYLLNSGTSIISVTGCSNYEQQVLDYANGLVFRDKDIIPNIKAVTDKIKYDLFNSSSNNIKRNDTAVRVFDSEITQQVVSYRTVGTANVITIDHTPISNFDLNVTTSSYVTISNCDSPAMNGTWPVITAPTNAYYFIIQIETSVSYSDVPFVGSISIVGYNSNAVVFINGNAVHTINGTQSDLYNLRFSGTTIQTTSGSSAVLQLTSEGSLALLANNGDTTITATSGNMSLTASGTITIKSSDAGDVKIDDTLTLTNQSVPAIISNTTRIYSAAHGQGNTGLFFVNSSYSDEFISKKKAIAFSILM